MGTYDMHKAYGYTDFDVVYLNDCYAMPYYLHIKNELRYRMAFPEWKGTVYYIDT